MKFQTTVILGDPRLPDKIKKDGKFGSEDFEIIEDLKQNLSLLKNFEFQYLDNHKTLIDQLMTAPPKFVFNSCDEGFNNQGMQELHIPALLEMLNIPYTGAAPACLALCYDKSIIYLIADSLGVPVPNQTHYFRFNQADSIPHIFPAMIKPNFGDGSFGITQRALVQNSEELNNYIKFLNKEFPDISFIIQEYLGGPEYSVGLIGNPGKLEALPLHEVDYSNLPEHLPKILCHEAKWLPDSPFRQNIQFKEANLSQETKHKLIEYSTILFERLECRDYARFDFRSDLYGNIKLLEVNPNPGGLAPMADFAGISYDKLLEKILNTARKRLDL